MFLYASVWAGRYTCAVDMWSIGTILAELLLGHLPFQGQDSTQQHLVEIMKLLGTPSDRELRAMQSNFVSTGENLRRPRAWRGDATRRAW